MIARGDGEHSVPSVLWSFVPFFFVAFQEPSLPGTVVVEKFADGKYGHTRRKRMVQGYFSGPRVQESLDATGNGATQPREVC